MKILFCGETFSRAPLMLRALLPDEEILASPIDQVKERGMTVDVIIPLMHRLEPELIAGTAARLIHQWGVGLEGVDIPAATARGILVCNVPGDATPNAESTAEHAVFLMMGLARRIRECFAAFQEGLWGAPVGEALFGNTALIVGLGRVGKALARRLTALGMRVQAISRIPDPETEVTLGVTRTAHLSCLLDMASTADFVISTITLNEETGGIFNRKLFQSMKKTAFVINVSRGPVLNEHDLLQALDERIIAGAGLDVYSREPLEPTSPLLSRNDVFATPHVAGATRQNYEGIAGILADNLTLFKEGKRPRFCVNAG
ncbi:MAG: NAD(P)-dependent oxidoreductase [Desulfomonilaceae bacterium]